MSAFKVAGDRTTTQYAAAVSADATTPSAASTFADRRTPNKELDPRWVAVVDAIDSNPASGFLSQKQRNQLMSLGVSAPLPELPRYNPKDPSSRPFGAPPSLPTSLS